MRTDGPLLTVHVVSLLLRHCILDVHKHNLLVGKAQTMSADHTTDRHQNTQGLGHLNPSSAPEDKIYRRSLLCLCRDGCSTHAAYAVTTWAVDTGTYIILSSRSSSRITQAWTCISRHGHLILT